MALHFQQCAQNSTTTTIGVLMFKVKSESVKALIYTVQHIRHQIIFMLYNFSWTTIEAPSSTVPFSVSSQSLYCTPTLPFDWAGRPSQFNAIKLNDESINNESSIHDSVVLCVHVCVSMCVCIHALTWITAQSFSSWPSLHCHLDCIAHLNSAFILAKQSCQNNS